MKKFIYPFIFLGLLACKANKDTTQRPNVIVIMADDLGYETIGANGGSSYQTPEIDRMASEGMRFEHCYAQPLCTPSRVKLMTGIYNVRNYVRFGVLDKSQTTFGHLFREAGYETCIVGKWQLGKEPESPHLAGFDQHCLWQVTEGRIDSTGRDTRFSKPVLAVDGVLKTFGEDDYGPDVVSTYGMDFIEKSHEAGKPFLLYYPMILTHCPFSPTPNSSAWRTDSTATMTYKGQASYFGDMVNKTDQIVGKINQKLKELGIADNTIVIFTGDNGTDVPIVSTLNGREVAGAKGQTVDAGTRVPLIVKWPSYIKANNVEQSLVDFSDFLPTISQAANIVVPDSLAIDGRSFLPQLLGEVGTSRDWIYTWYSRNGQAKKARIFARNHQYKLYTTGEFYEVPEDYDESKPIDVASLDAEAKQVHDMLQEVLMSYESLRFNKIPVMKTEAQH